MTYEVLDTQAGDVLAVYSSLDEASVAILSYVEEHPEMAADVAVAAVNGRGVPDQIYAVSELQPE